MNNTTTESLKNHIDDLNQQAWNVRINDSSAALKFSQESVKLAREINYPRGLAEGLRSLGFCYLRLFKNEEADVLLKESLSLFESLNDLRGQGVVYEYLGIIQRNWGNLGASLDLLLKGHGYLLHTAPEEFIITSCYHIGVTYKHLGNYDNALDYLFQSLSRARNINFTLMIAYAMNIIGSIYFDNGDYRHALEYYEQGLVIRRQLADKWGEAGSLDNIGFTYLRLKHYDLATSFCKQSLAISQSTDDQKGQSNVLLHLAEISKESGEFLQAKRYSNDSLEIRRARGDKRGEAEVLLFLAELNIMSAGSAGSEQILQLLSSALLIAETIQAQDLTSKAHYRLYEYHRENGNFKESLRHAETHLQMEKELHKNAISQKALNLEISYKAEETKREADAARQRNEELTALNKKIEEQKGELEEALVELKATQNQLVQSEKMASLGELTAGIAHEIQNPLNFVNNFSEINSELIEELRSELETGNTQSAIEVAGTIKENEEKINHHGKRADAIVKAMLQHSRLSSGQNELTDINGLADEYLSIAYHGFRAKDKSFSAVMKTEFDDNIGKINLVPQQMGRVLLNLINNAFYAVNEKQKDLRTKSDAGYCPAVIVATKKTNGKVEISVSDNGNGVPSKIIDKIFQPFFTTKPTGVGTGLGLSLAYDIVTKEHGGELTVNTTEGEGSNFVVRLPVARS